MRLYGNDIDETTTVLEAGLEWIVSWDKGDFMGRDALGRQHADGPTRRLVGFEMIDRAIARHGYRVLIANDPVGHVTSGTLTPFLNKAIGMAYLPAGHAQVGAEFEVDIRGRHARARVVDMPFYKRSRS